VTFPIPIIAAGRVFALGALLAASVSALAQTDPLPSWNDGAAKQAIVAFVKGTTEQGSPTFVPPAERIATFDRDGTLWVEHPMYSQVMYILESVPALVKAKPDWPTRTLVQSNSALIEHLAMTRIESITHRCRFQARNATSITTNQTSRSATRACGR
jgi:hypothetical protein